MNKKHMMQLMFKFKGIKGIRYLYWPVYKLRCIVKDFLYPYSKDCNYIKSLKGKYEGKKCFIVGNGPSLTVSDLEMIRNEISFASNGILDIFDKTVWRPNYYFACDAEVIMNNHKKYRNIEGMDIFLSYIAKKYFIKNPNIHYINEDREFSVTRYSNKHSRGFSHDVSKMVYTHATITYTMIQFAAYMGFHDIYLIGMDHKYSRVMLNGVVKEDKSVVNNHFNSSKETGIKYIFNKEAVENDYYLAKEETEKIGVNIFNVTRGGMLEIFPRKELEDTMDEVTG